MCILVYLGRPPSCSSFFRLDELVLQTGSFELCFGNLKLSLQLLDLKWFVRAVHRICNIGACESTWCDGERGARANACSTGVCVFDLIFIRNKDPAGTSVACSRSAALSRCADLAALVCTLLLTVDCSVLSTTEASLCVVLESKTRH